MACLPLDVMPLGAAYFDLLPTCLSGSELPQTGLPSSVQAQVMRLAQLAAHCACHGGRVFADSLEQFTHD